MRTQKQAEKVYSKLLSMNQLERLRYAEKMKLTVTQSDFVADLEHGIDSETDCYYVKYPFYGVTYSIKVYYRLPVNYYAPLYIREK